MNPSWSAALSWPGTMHMGPARRDVSEKWTRWALAAALDGNSPAIWSCTMRPRDSAESSTPFVSAIFRTSSMHFTTSRPSLGGTPKGGRGGSREGGPRRVVCAVGASRVVSLARSGSSGEGAYRSRRAAANEWFQTFRVTPSSQYPRLPVAMPVAVASTASLSLRLLRRHLAPPKQARSARSTSLRRGIRGRF
jgi:hypothetical protein